MHYCLNNVMIYSYKNSENFINKKTREKRKERKNNAESGEDIQQKN